MRAPAWLKRLDHGVLEWIYPVGVVCVACGRPSHGGRLCRECQAFLDEERLPPEEGARAVYAHRGVARDLVHRLKYDALADAAEILAQPMAELARSLPLSEDTVVTWVAMPKARRRERGIDHGRVLAEAVARRLHLSARPLLVRTKNGAAHTQQGLSREERLRNLSTAFACVDEMPAHILLVDDVLTTGATIRACTDCLLSGGAQSVTAITATKAER